MDRLRTQDLNREIIAGRREFSEREDMFGGAVPRVEALGSSSGFLMAGGSFGIERGGS